jgi:hypothetical protein
VKNILIITTGLLVVAFEIMAQQEDELESHHSTNAVFMIGESAISAGETYRGELLVPSVVKYLQ